MRSFGMVGLTVVVLLVVSPTWARADNFSVNDPGDAVDAAPGDGTCATAGGVCTLRAAIQEANAHAGDDTIGLPAGTYSLTIPPGAETSTALDAAAGDLDITGNLTITGAGATTTIIDGGHATRIFHVASSQTVTISALTVRNGTEAGGGGIFAVGNLTLNDVVVTGNSCLSGAGGGIRGGGALTLNGTTVSDNGCTNQGAGIFGGSPVTIDRSTITANHSSDQGGGIFSDGPLTITRSTISGNMSGDQGGGIFIENGAMTIVNSTISGNSAPSAGGGIFNNPPLGPASNTVRILNSTITGNTGSDGGGVFTFDPGVVTLRNTILAANTDTGGAAPDFDGMLGSEGFNLIGSTSGGTIVGDTTGNITGQAPGLSALADNGGPTLTHALLSGSPALDQGDPAGCVDAQGSPLMTDQRGQPRPQGARCDIGAGGIL